MTVPSVSREVRPGEGGGHWRRRRLVLLHRGGQARGEWGKKMRNEKTNLSVLRWKGTGKEERSSRSWGCIKIEDEDLIEKEEEKRRNRDNRKTMKKEKKEEKEKEEEEKKKNHTTFQLEAISPIMRFRNCLHKYNDTPKSQETLKFESDI